MSLDYGKDSNKKIYLNYVRENSFIYFGGNPTTVKVKGKPIGVVVALVDLKKKKYSLGMSLCCKKDVWDRDKGKYIAVCRAEKGKSLQYWKKVFKKQIPYSNFSGSASNLRIYKVLVEMESLDYYIKHNVLNTNKEKKTAKGKKVEKIK